MEDYCRYCPACEYLTAQTLHIAKDTTRAIEGTIAKVRTYARAQATDQ